MARRAAGRDPPQSGPEPELRIGLFGHVAVEVNGTPFKLATPRKALPVLAYLLLNRDAPIARDFLAYVMWPDDEEEPARTKLRLTLYDLARVLPPELEGRALIVDGDSVCLRPDLRLCLDVEEFNRLIGDPQRIEEAVSLYRGDLLAALYDEWVFPERERYRNVFLAGLLQLVSQARRQRNFVRGIARAQQILAMDPWREDVVRQVMALRCESGDRAGALAEYERFAKLLRLELKVQPMPETLTLRETIARGDVFEPNAPLESAAAASTFARSATLPFVGRRAEMEQLLETWSRAARGHGSCVFIGGEPGVGKSRLILEFAHAVEESGGRVLIGATGSPEATPYESVVDALRSALPLVASLKGGMWLACIAELLPEIRTRLDGLPAVPRIDAESERIRLFESLFRCFSGLAQPRPLLLVLEDMHWAQSASITLLRSLLRRVSGVPIMLVVTYRDNETPRPHPLHRLRSEARAAACAHSLSLRTLSLDDVHELTDALPEIPDLEAANLLTVSAGNPLFLTQFIDDLRHGERTAAPASLEALLTARIGQLSEEARTLAEIAAFVGSRFSHDALRDVSGWDEAAIGGALDELFDRRIVREATGRGLFEYAFSHQIFQEAIARAVPQERAAARHRRVARVLEELYADRASELSATIARHYELAGDGANAARSYLTAVRRSIGIGALDEARALSERALALTEDPRARAEILLERETVELRRGDRSAQESALASLKALAASLADSDLHRLTLLREIEFATSISDTAKLATAIRELRTLALHDDTAWQVHVAEAKFAYSQGRLAEAHASAETALAFSRGSANGAGITQALCCLANVEADRGNLSAAEALFDEAERAAVDATDPVLEYFSLSSAFSIAYNRRDLERCMTLGQRWLDRATALGDRPAEARARGRLGVTLTAAGTRYAEAREHFANAALFFTDLGDMSKAAGETLNQAVLETRLGFFEKAVAATEKAVALFEGVRDERGRVIGLANLGFLRACAGNIEGAQSIAREARELAQQLEFGLIEASALENLAFAEAAAGKLTDAIAHAEMALEVRARSQSEVWASKTLADLAVWHAALANLPAAHNHVRRLLADEKGLPDTTEWPEYCYWVAAQVFRLEGNLPEAARALDRARAIVQAAAEGLDADDRESFAAISWHVDIAAAAQRDVWPDPPR
ncbi:MAG TPA: AAA family ATPase [Candidatus Cybelea sp.]|nr:AAA family ATPase [Candidatus Cybelea sp.]